MVTSGTVTSAKMMAERLPPNAFHQFVPLDVPAAVRRFLDHWRPDIGLFVDSEIWPNMLSQAHARGIPLALINGRMSARAFAGWSRARSMAGDPVTVRRVPGTGFRDGGTAADAGARAR